MTIMLSSDCKDTSPGASPKDDDPLQENVIETAYSKLAVASSPRRRRVFGRTDEPTDSLAHISVLTENADLFETNGRVEDYDDDDKSLFVTNQEESQETLHEEGQHETLDDTLLEKEDDEEEALKDDKDNEETALNEIPEDETSLETLPAETTTGRTQKSLQERKQEAATKDEETTAASDSLDNNTESVTPPTLEAILASTDNLFQQVTDKQTVTVKDIMKSLRAEYNCKLDKSLKDAVRERLIHLINENVADEVSDVGELESESEAEVEPSSDYEDETPSKKSSKRRTSQRKSTSASKKKALRVHAERLRKRRMEELRVRNEELMVHQSKEDQKRAELIAAKFETDTDERRLQRLEHRLDLLQMLDQKRITVIQSDDNVALSALITKKDENPPPPAAASTEESDEESDDDMELEIVGRENHSKLSLKPNALSILDIADKVNIRPRKKKSGPQASPGRSLRARAALRNQLLAKQRKMGNMWLARELGYKTEEDHIRDCMEAEEKKRQQILQREAERLKANERKQLRERMLTNQQEDVNDDEEEWKEEPGAEEKPADEDDEEEALAKAIEQEHAANRVDAGPMDNDNDDVPMPDADEAEEPMPNTDKDESPNIESGTLETQLPAVLSVDASAEDGLETQLPSVVHPESIDATGPENVQGSNEMPYISEELEPSSTTEDDDIEAPDKSLKSEINDSAVDHSESVEKKDEAGEEEIGGLQIEADENQDPEKPKGPRNSAWQAMLQKEKEQLKKMKKRKAGLVEEEADEEEEEEVAGLEDFGFKVHKKDKDDNDEDEDEFNEEDLKHVVDELSDDEGDEDAGEEARKQMEQREEKERHKEILRRLREGYDGRRGGIAVGGAGARGMHRFDQLVAADNREDAKLLGLLNDDEFDSDQEEGDKPDEEEDEAALVDKMLKDRFLHRSSVELENFSDDEEEEEEKIGEQGEGMDEEEQEVKEQERLAKRFAKRARMQRLLETYGEDEEFTQSKLIEEDATMKLELQKMKNGLSRKRSQSSISRGSSTSTSGPTSDASTSKKKKTAGSLFRSNGGSLAIALQASRRNKSRTSFLRNGSGGSSSEATSSLQKSIAFNHVVFRSESQLSNGKFSNSTLSRGGAASKGRHSSKPKPASRSTSLWSKAVVGGFQKRR